MQDTRAAATEQFMKDIPEYQFPYNRMRIKNLLNPAKVNDVSERITTESQLEFIIGNSDNTEGNTGDDNDNQVYTTAEDLKAFAIALSVLETQR